MIITRTSPISGVTRSMDLPITPEQIEAHANGEYIQVAMRNLTAGQREFYMTGITDEEWDKTFRDEDEPEDDRNEGREYDDFQRQEADHKNLYEDPYGGYLTDDEEGLTQM